MSKQKKIQIRSMRRECSLGAMALDSVGVRAEYAVKADSPRNGMVLLTEVQAVEIALIIAKASR